MLFKRVCGLEVGIISLSDSTKVVEKIDIRGLRIAFQVKKFQSFSTNSSQIRVWNLSQDKRNRINDFSDQIQLFAGYEKDVGEALLFLGNTTFVSHKFTVPDIISAFDCNSGERLFNDQQIILQMEGNFSIQDVIQKIASLCKVELDIRAEIPNQRYQKGFSQSGSVRFMLDKVCDKASICWTIFDKKLVILPRFTSTSAPTFEMSENTGLIGYPERFAYRSRWLPNGGYKPGYRAKTALLPYVEPGRSVRLKSKFPGVDQEFFVANVTHTGDTHGEVWQSEFELIAKGIS